MRFALTHSYSAMLRVASIVRPLRPHLVASMAAQGTRTRELSSTASSRAPIKNVAVIGSGLMGSGIAQVCVDALKELSISANGVDWLCYCMQVAAQTGHSVFLVDVKEELLDKARTSISASIGRVAKKTFSEDPKVSQ